MGSIAELFIALGIEPDDKSFKAAENSVKQLRSTATKLLGAIGIGFSLVKLKQMSEEFGKINTKIKDATEGLGDQMDIQDAIMKAANGSRQSYSGMADTVTKLMQNKDAFNGVEDAANFAGLLAKNFAAAGKSEGEVNSLMQTVNLSMSRGVMDSRAYLQILRQSPQTIGMMADSLGVTQDAFQQMVSKGQVSAQTFKRLIEQNADKIESRYGRLPLTISDSMLMIRNEWGNFVAQTDEQFGLTQEIAKFMVTGFRKLLSFLQRTVALIDKVIKKLGGIKNTLKVIAMVAAPIMYIMNAKKILDFIGNVKKGLTAVNAKILAIIAVVVLIGLAVDDLIHFMRGDASFIGVIFEKFGIDADKARETIVNAWNKVKEFFSIALEFIRNLFLKIGTWLRDFWEKHGEQIIASLKATWDTIVSIFQVAFNLITDAFDFWIKLFSGDWAGAWESLKTFITDLKDGAIAIITSLFEWFDTIFGGLPTKALEWGKGFIDGLIGGIADKINAVKEAAGNVIGGIKNFLGFNSPADEGEGQHIVEWGGNMVRGFMDGMKQAEPELRAMMSSMMSGMMADMKALAGVAQAMPITAAAAASSVSNKSVSMTNNFNNQFHGDRAGQQKSAAAMDKASGSATGELARALQFVR